MGARRPPHHVSATGSSVNKRSAWWTGSAPAQLPIARDAPEPGGRPGRTGARAPPSTTTGTEQVATLCSTEPLRGADSAPTRWKRAG